MSSDSFTYTSCSTPAEVYAVLLDTQGKVLADYIWIDTDGTTLRNKTKVLDSKPESPEQCPVVVVDVSANSSMEVDGQNQEVYLKPRKIFRDPFRGGDHVLVLCDVFQPPPRVSQPDLFTAPTLEPAVTNNRVACEKVIKAASASQPLFAAEQEYLVTEPTSSHKPLPSSSGSDSYGGKPCGPAKSYVYTDNSCGSAHSAGKPPNVPRELSEAHLRYCLHAGIKITGASETATHGKWSYKVGPSTGVDMSDDLWTSRYLLRRLSDKQGVSVQLDADPSNTAAPTCHFKYSTSQTRQPAGGMFAIQQHLQKLQATHLQTTVAYGANSLQLLLSKNAAAFTVAAGSKEASITLPGTSLFNQCGYYIDRRPAGAVDPYVVTTMLTSITLDIPTALPPAIAAPISIPAPTVQRRHSLLHPTQPEPSSGSCCSGSCSMNVPILSSPLSARHHPLLDTVDCEVNSGQVDEMEEDCEVASLDDEDLLIDELEKIDHEFFPDTPDNTFHGLRNACDDDCWSDCCSPNEASFLQMHLSIAQAAKRRCVY